MLKALWCMWLFKLKFNINILDQKSLAKFVDQKKNNCS